MRTRLWIVVLGVALGLALKFTFGGPADAPQADEHSQSPAQGAEPRSAADDTDP